jgi:hypothetical protein
MTFYPTSFHSENQSMIEETKIPQFYHFQNQRGMRLKINTDMRDSHNEA